MVKNCKICNNKATRIIQHCKIDTWQNANGKYDSLIGTKEYYLCAKHAQTLKIDLNYRIEQLQIAYQVNKVPKLYAILPRVKMNKTRRGTK